MWDAASAIHSFWKTSKDFTKKVRCVWLFLTNPHKYNISFDFFPVWLAFNASEKYQRCTYDWIRITGGFLAGWWHVHIWKYWFLQYNWPAKIFDLCRLRYGPSGLSWLGYEKMLHCLEARQTWQWACKSCDGCHIKNGWMNEF